MRLERKCGVADMKTEQEKRSRVYIIELEDRRVWWQRSAELDMVV